METVCLFVQQDIRFPVYPALPEPFLLTHTFFRMLTAQRLPVVVMDRYHVRF
jgi:hypothetical protein